jgi:hypothetical protein
MVGRGGRGRALSPTRLAKCYTAEPFETGPSMTPGLREGFPSTDEILSLVNAERRKGFSKEKAFDNVAARLMNG